MFLVVRDTCIPTRDDKTVPYPYRSIVGVAAVSGSGDMSMSSTQLTYYEETQ